jgi:hypothetical protein
MTADRSMAAPLNSDPDALSTSEYVALIQEMQKTEDPCPVAVPAAEVAAALERLDG